MTTLKTWNDRSKQRWLLAQAFQADGWTVHGVEAHDWHDYAELGGYYVHAGGVYDYVSGWTVSEDAPVWLQESVKEWSIYADRNNWVVFIEGGDILLSGTGLYRLPIDGTYSQVQAIMQRIERAVEEHKAGQSDRATFEIGPSSIGKDEFCEVRFQDHTPLAMSEALELAGYRWSRTSGAWYGLRDKLPAMFTEGGE